MTTRFFVLFACIFTIVAIFWDINQIFRIWDMLPKTWGDFQAFRRINGEYSGNAIYQIAQIKFLMMEMLRTLISLLVAFAFTLRFHLKD